MPAPSGSAAASFPSRTGGRPRTEHASVAEGASDVFVKIFGSEARPRPAGLWSAEPAERRAAGRHRPRVRCPRHRRDDAHPGVDQVPLPIPPLESYEPTILRINTRDVLARLQRGDAAGSRAFRSASRPSSRNGCSSRVMQSDDTRRALVRRIRRRRDGGRSPAATSAGLHAYHEEALLRG